MASRPNPFEKPLETPPLRSEGPLAPQIAQGEVISSGPLGSSLRKTIGREVHVPEDKEIIGQLARRIPDKFLPSVVEFLRRVVPGRAEEAAIELLKQLKELGHRIDQAQNPKRELERCIEVTEERLKKTVN